MNTTYSRLNNIFGFGLPYILFTRTPYALNQFLVGVHPTDVLNRILQKTAREKNLLEVTRERVAQVLTCEEKLRKEVDERLKSGEFDVDSTRFREASSRRAVSRRALPGWTRDELMAREKKRRANRAFARAKQVWIWMAALGFSYADLITTVFVGMEYLRVGGKAGRDAARAMFGMLGGSLLVQAFTTYATGKKSRHFVRSQSLCASRLKILVVIMCM